MPSPSFYQQSTHPTQFSFLGVKSERRDAGTTCDMGLSIYATIASVCERTAGASPPVSSIPQGQIALAVAAFMVKAGDDRAGRKLYIVGEEMSVKISSRDTNGTFAVVEALVPAGGGPPLHRHACQDEWWYIVDGQFRFEVDGNEIQAGPGDTVFAPRGSCHAFQNAGNTAGRMMTTVVPGGLDLFFEELSAALPPGADPNPGALGGLYQRYGIELLGPPLGKRRAA